MDTTILESMHVFQQLEQILLPKMFANSSIIHVLMVSVRLHVLYQYIELYILVLNLNSCFIVLNVLYYATMNAY